jgi:hypothetical protein
MIGCTKKSRKLDIKIVIANRFLFNIFFSKKLILGNYELNHKASKNDAGLKKNHFKHSLKVVKPI